MKKLNKNEILAMMLSILVVAVILVGLALFLSLILWAAWNVVVVSALSITVALPFYKVMLLVGLLLGAVNVVSIIITYNKTTVEKWKMEQVLKNYQKTISALEKTAPEKPDVMRHFNM